MNDKSILREIPSVDLLKKKVNTFGIDDKILTTIIRKEVDAYRQKILLSNQIKTGKLEENLIDLINAKIISLRQGNFQQVINGTGIVLHTNLGRAPLSRDIFDDMKNVLAGYVNLEMDTKTGKRGERLALVREYLQLLSGTEDAIIVNNNAAALILLLNTFCDKKEVVVSRGELIEIGGSFRLPDVIEKSGAIIKEVGTTNRTHFTDYDEAITKNTGAILVTHTSNYTVEGFTATPDRKDLVGLAKDKKIPLIIDQGSGYFCEADNEYDIKSVFASGADLICFSGDKLLGGPQSGIILGKRQLLKQVKKNPLYRAFRCDKMILYTLEWTLKKIIANQQNDITTNYFLNRNMSEIQKIGESILASLSKNMIRKFGLQLVDSVVETGSGSSPTKKIKSKALLFSNMPAEKLASDFRQFTPPLFGYICKNKFFIDLKAIKKDDVSIISSHLTKIYTQCF